MTIRYRVLSLDGGGFRGLLASRLLERLHAARPRMLDAIDLFAGTSTGAILALSLAAGHTPQQTSRLYLEHGNQVFDENLWDITDIDRLVRADYRGEGLHKALTKTFGSLTMGDLPRRALVATFDLDSGSATREGLRSWKPKFVHNFEEPGSTDRDQLVVDVAMRSCSAPTYFPVYQGYVDGGVVANNPSMCALAQALHADTGKQHASYIALLSLGTGASPRWIEEQDADWGYVQWAKPLLGIVFEGGSGIADYQCRQILGRRYHRVNPVLDKPIALDSVESGPELELVAAGTDLGETLQWVDRHFAAG